MIGLSKLVTCESLASCFLKVELYFSLVLRSRLRSPQGVTNQLEV